MQLSDCAEALLASPTAPERVREQLG